MSHIYRDVNYCVNVLVKMGHDRDPTRFMLDIAPLGSFFTTQKFYVKDLFVYLL